MGRTKRLSNAEFDGRRRPGLGLALAVTLVPALLIVQCEASPLKAEVKFKPAVFKYVSGTEDLPQNCVGKLEVNSDSLVYNCPQGSVKIPYSSIVVMEYRSNVNRDLRRMNLPWVFEPWSLRQKTNRYFTIVYSQAGERHALVLDVPPDSMRPYFAEIDLQSGRRVEVQSHEKYY